jgi:hypothetical protein
MTETKKKNPQDATLRNVRAAKKVDAHQDADIDALQAVVRSLMDQVKDLDGRLARLERAVHNPLGLQT